jgi:hypothetical protein
MQELFVKKNKFLLLIVLVCALLSYVNCASSKRGIGWPLENKQDSPNLFQGGKVKWFYNWSSDKRSTSSMEFVPMYWSSSKQNPQDFVNKVTSQRAKVILGFNEPERGDQANMSPAAAAKIWKQYIEPLRKKGVRLGSPAVSSAPAGVQWLQEFLKQGAQIDFIALHWYGEGADNFINYVQNTRKTLGNRYPVWVTEFACTSWNANKAASQNEINQFFQQTTSRLDRLSWVERYAWFGASRNLDASLGNGNRLIGANGKLSALGQKYVRG